MSWLGLLLLGVVLYVVGALIAEVAFLTTVGIIVVVAALVWLVVGLVSSRGNSRTRL